MIILFTSDGLREGHTSEACIKLGPHKNNNSMRFKQSECIDVKWAFYTQCINKQFFFCKIQYFIINNFTYISLLLYKWKLLLKSYKVYLLPFIRYIFFPQSNICLDFCLNLLPFISTVNWECFFFFASQNFSISYCYLRNARLEFSKLTITTQNYNDIIQ